MRKLVFITAIVFLPYFGVYGQISTLEEPISFRTNVPTLRASEKTQIILPSLDMKKIEQEDKEDEANGIPPRFGYPHNVNFNLDNSGEWTVLSDGSRIWRLALHCPDALSINLLYDKFWVPDDAKFFVYSNDRRHSIGAFTSVNNKGNRNDIQGFATGLVYGDQVVLEYYLPSDVKEVGIISIAYVVHGYRYIFIGDDEKNLNQYGASGSCNINVNCPEGNNWQSEKNAVAKILMNGTRLCTGSLVNTTANDMRPLFLTADHCMGGLDAITDNSPTLPFWIFYWHFESPTCTNSIPIERSTNAAQLVSNNPTSDFALLQLTENPLGVNGITPYYLGWDRSGNAGTGGVGIHHPRGDIKKITPYVITPQSTNYLNNTVDVNGNHWRVTWSSGTTEGGSSGSPLINSNRRVIGQLRGGYASCSAQTQPDWYGKFNISWTGNGAADSRRRLSNWLDPNNTNATTLNGIACPTIVNFIGTVTTPIIVTSNTTIVSCGDINVQYVKVQNGAKLILDAAGEVNIISDFEVDLGSEFEIKY